MKYLILGKADGAVVVLVHSTHARWCNLKEVEEEEEEEEAVFIRGVNTNEDSPNAQHAPHQEEEEEEEEEKEAVFIRDCHK